MRRTQPYKSINHLHLLRWSHGKQQQQRHTLYQTYFHLLEVTEKLAIHFVHNSVTGVHTAAAGIKHQAASYDGQVTTDLYGRII